MAAGARREHRRASARGAFVAVATAALALGVLAPAPTSGSHTGAPHATLDGVVRTTSAAIIAGATVDVLQEDTQNVVATADSASDGTYALEVPEGRYDVRVVLPGTGVRSRQTTPDVVIEGEKHLDVFVQEDMVTVTGTVRDAGGAPMNDMGIVFVSGIGGFGGFTGSDGTFTLFMAPGHYDLEVRPGFSRPFIGSVRVPVDLVAGTTPNFDLTFPQRSITVSVEDAAGNPAANVFVRPNATTPPVVDNVLPGVDGTANLFGSANTDANGVATLPVIVTDDPIPLVLTAPANATYGSTTATVPGGGTTIDVSLPATNSVTGVVTDAQGQPLPNASVSLAGTGPFAFETPVAYTSTDANGAFLMRAVPDDYRISASQYTAGTPGGPYSSWGRSETLTLSGDITHDITLPATEALTVDVTDAGGAPITNTTVTARSAGAFASEGDFSYASAPVDAAGTVTLSTLAAGDVIVSVQPASGFGVERTLSDPGPSATVALDPATTVSGVLTLGGTPFASAAITVSGMYGRVNATTAADGSFSVAAPAGTHRISASSPFPWSPNFFVEGPIAVSAGGRHVVLDIPTSEVTHRSEGTLANLNIGTWFGSGPGFDFADGPAAGQWGLFVLDTDLPEVVVEAIASPATRVHTTTAPLLTDLSEARTLLFMRGVADDAPPTIEAVVSPPPTDDGWNNSGPVTVSFSCGDNGNEFAWVQCPGSVTVNGPTDGEVVEGVAVDQAGNRTKTSVTVKIDDVVPTITAAPDAEPNAAGWYRGDVTFSFTCDDDRSGVASCSSPATLTGEGLGLPVEGTVVDRAGNSAVVGASANIDRTPPTIHATVEPATPASGWYPSGSVTVTFHCDDGLSGVASCSSPVTVSTEGATAVDGVVTDAAGWSASTSVTVKLDFTAPTGTPQYPAGAVGGWYGTAVAVPLSCDDPLSGVASCPSASFVSEGAGQQQAVTISDVAGHTASVTVSGVHIDLSAPDTALPGSLHVKTSLGGTVTGSATDALSGVTRVVVEYVGTGTRPPTQVDATLVCNTGATSCTWSAPPPARSGRYTARAVAYDRVGRADPTPATSTLVVV